MKEDILIENRELVACACTSLEHQMVITTGDFNDEAYIHIHLSKKPFLKRLVYAVRYVLGRKCRYGAFDEMILTPNHIPQFQRLINYLNRNHP